MVLVEGGDPWDRQDHAVVCLKCEVVVLNLGGKLPHQLLVDSHRDITDHKKGSEVFWTTNDRVDELRKKHKLEIGSLSSSAGNKETLVVGANFLREEKR